jgi:predicted permease
VFSALLEVVLPVVFITFIGTFIGRFLRPDQQSLSKITLYALSPALAFDNLSSTAVRFEVALAIIVGYVMFESVMGWLTWFSSRDLDDRTRRAMVAGVITGNNGNFGLPISLFAFGKAGLELSLIVFTVSVFFTFVVTPAVLSHGGNWQSRFVTVLKLPLVWAAMGGVLMNVFELRIPVGLERGVHLLGQAAIPMLLIALGLQIGASGLPRLTQPILILHSSSLRLFLGPVVAFGVATLLGLRDLERNVLVLSAAMPTAINAFLISLELKSDVQTVAGTVVLTTFGSIGTIALVVSLLR